MDLNISVSAIKLVVFDFDGVFTDNAVYVDQNGIETVRCSRSDGLGLQRLVQMGIKVFIVSTEENPVVGARAQKLKLPCIQGTKDKATTVLTICTELDIDPKSAMFVGNDINDIPAFKVVGMPVGVADSYPEIYPYILHRTKLRGGYGAVREICDLLFESIKLHNPGS